MAFASTGPFAQTTHDFDDTSLTVVQQKMVAHLTGYGGSQREERIGPRSTPAERNRAAIYLANTLMELGLVAMRHDYHQPNVNGFVDLLLSPYRGTNIYTIVGATMPSTEYVIVGAHYDSVPGSPGAGDNASGVALVYSLAAKLAKQDIRPLNFILVFFDQEEDDEVGSRAFVQYLKNKSYSVHSVHITDLSGWDKDGDRVIEVQSPGPELGQWYQEAANRLGINLILPRGASSDNKSFLNAGYQTTGVFGEVNRHLHKSSDTYETVDFVYLASMTTLMFEVLSNLTEKKMSYQR